MRAANGVTLEAPPDPGPPHAGPPYGVPTASANLYCDGQLDAAIVQVIAPVWRWTNARGAGRTALWIMRYSRGGEHLKIRLHSPPELTALIIAELERAAEIFFEQMPPSDPTRTRRFNNLIPPIDTEDAVAEPHPDRTLLWTEYRCPPDHMGPAPLSSAKGFARSYTAALSAATDIVLERIQSSEAQPPGLNERVSLFASFLLAMATLPVSLGSDVFAHQRDWLLGGAKADVPSALSYMDKRIAAGPGQCDALRARWSTATRGEPIPGLQDFSSALEEHVTLSLDALGTPEMAEIDEHKARQLFGAIARVFHKVANQLGIDLSNEIYLCHLLHRASSPPSC